ncbi:MAG: LysR family transcriptional regulator [Cyanobacteria bacterium J06621_11]
MNWDDLKIFLALSRQGSARAAADKLGIHHSTITRRIEAFEATQKAHLFDRLHTGYSLTPAGEALLESAARIEAEIDSIERNILGKEVELKGDIRVTMPDAIAIHLLMPDIVRFMDTYPDINVKVQVSYSLLSLTKRETDIAIRLTDKPLEHLVGRKLIRYHIANYAAKQYLKERNFPTKRENVHWIGWNYPVACDEWIAQSEFPTLPARGYFNNALAQLAAVKAGLGIARLPCFMGDPDPSIQRIPPGKSTPFHDIWILTHKDLLSTARIQLFMDFIAEAFRKKRDLLKGQNK